ncbi:hypothetical protein AXG93_1865s1080 [Marchantia polymorpha subsp. ruderalis]|uniref:Uncharacterized protein n=1 Tax=Marchantia polymorpha subsp. ruderalis TaxID=1480154 RepID=A0A176WI52_MARPO|nr:hypothetical protein AXG93_1865s1080 [Marchantia polymorpha subsp. ruderalis]
MAIFDTLSISRDLYQEEGVFECLKDVDDNVPCGQVGSHDDYHKIGHHTPSRVDLKAFPGKELRDGKSYQGEQPTGPISSVVRLFFGTQSEEPRADEERTANNLQDVYPIIRKKVEHLEAEIVNFTKGNRKIKTLLKEQEDNAAQLKQEKAAWEQQKASDMEAFQKFKEAQLNMLQKERSKLEHQARATSSKTAKKDDRRALDELRATLAQEQNAHFKKEQQWRLTSNRLRNANKDLLEQIQELRKEIGRHEAQILLQLDARESGSDTSAQSSQTKARGMKQRDTIKSRFTQGLPTAGSQLGTSTVIGDDSMISRDARNIKQVKSHIASTCDEATMMLAQKMKDLEEDVESWTYFHPD